MSYATIHRCANDAAFQDRITACCAQEGAAEPSALMLEMVWPIATATDVAQAYESAIIGGVENPGGNESVITDQMILSHVQPLMPPATN